MCKIKYYNNCLFYDVQKDFIVQTGDPTGSGKGGESIYGYVLPHSHSLCRQTLQHAINILHYHAASHSTTQHHAAQPSTIQQYTTSYNIIQRHTTSHKHHVRRLISFISFVIFSILYGDDAKYFEDEIHLQVKHRAKGVVAMANEGKDMNGSRVCEYFSFLFCSFPFFSLVCFLFFSIISFPFLSFSSLLFSFCRCNLN